MNIKWLIEVCRLPAVMLSLILLFTCAPRWEVAWRSGGEDRLPSVRGAASSIKTARLYPDGPDIILAGTNDDGDGAKEILLYSRTGIYLLRMK